MAKFTTEVLTMVKLYSDETKPIRDRIIEAAPKIMDFPYPIWDESYRLTLNVKIIRHYIRSEIGLETVGLWKLFMETRMNEIMPAKIQLYYTTLEKFDGANDIDLTTALERVVGSEGSEVGSGSNKDIAESLGKDFPQAQVSPGDQLYYGTQGQNSNVTSDGNSTRDTISMGNEKSTTTRKGRLGARTQGQIIADFRDTIIDIDNEIISELHDLFMPLY